MAVKPIHILRYGTVADKIHLEKAISAYDYLSINGNTAAYVSSAIAKFIVEKFFSKQDKGFFIDPITYAFQNEIRLLKSKSKRTGREEIKKSVKKLIEKYGYPATKIEEGEPVTVNDFLDLSTKESFCKNILSFQYNLVYDHIRDNDLQKYLDYVAPKNVETLPQLRPSFLIAPYFYLDAQDPEFDRWLKLNIEFGEIACSQVVQSFENKEVYVQIVISKNTLLNPTILRKLIKAYESLNCTGYTVWVDDLCESEASEEDLNGFIRLLEGLKHKPVLNMYGGYFSILLTHKSYGLLAGVSHGLEYGENRKVYPVGGGIPVSKYYFLPLHQRLDFTKAYYLLENTKIIDTSKDNWGSPEQYYKKVCKCTQCRAVIKSEMINFVEFESREFYEVHRKEQVLRRKKASSDTKQNCLYHYLLCKKREFSCISKCSIDTLKADLLKQKNIYCNCDSIQEEELNYIDIWLKVLK